MKLPPGYELANPGFTLPPGYELEDSGFTLPKGYELEDSVSLPKGYSLASSVALPEGYELAGPEPPPATEAEGFTLPEGYAPTGKETSTVPSIDRGMAPVGRVADIGLGAAKGGVSLVQGATGLARMFDVSKSVGYLMDKAGELGGNSEGATNYRKGLVSTILDGVGYDPVGTKQYLSSMYSQEGMEDRNKFEAAEGVIDTLKVMATHPAVPLDMTVEMLPSMLGNIGAARLFAARMGTKAIQLAEQSGITDKVKIAELATAAAEKWGMRAAAITEGAQQGGSSFEEYEKEGIDEIKQYVASIGSAVTTAAAALVGGKIGVKLGLGDVEAGIGAKGANRFVKGIKGALQEGPIEEGTQSPTEQMWDNYAKGNPILQGVPKAWATGTALGAAMGGMMSAISNNEPPAPTLVEAARQEFLAALPEGMKPEDRENLFRAFISQNEQDNSEPAVSLPEGYVVDEAVSQPVAVPDAALMATELVSSADRDDITKKLDNLFGLDDNQWDEISNRLDTEDGFVAPANFDLANDYQADLEHAANNRDSAEVAAILAELSADPRNNSIPPAAKDGDVYPGSRISPHESEEGIEQSTESLTPGDQYVDLNEDHLALGGNPEAKTITRQDVLAPLLVALKQPVFEESIKRGAKKLGDFQHKTQRIRTRNRGDIEVVAHEVAHLVDDLVYNGFKGKGKGTATNRPWEKNKTFIAELRSVSYDKKKTHEGFAEFVRLWMTVPESLETTTPQFLAYWNNFVETGMDGNPVIAKALLEAKARSLQWFQQDMVKRIHSKIGRVPSLTDVVVEGYSASMRQSLIDSFHGVYLQEQRVTGSKTPAKNGMTETMALSRAKYSMASGAIDFGPIMLMPDGSFKYSDSIQGLSDIIGQLPHDQIDNWKAYAVARSANELMGQGRERLFTKAEIQEGLALNSPLFEKVFDEWLEFNGAILDFAESMGLINAKQRGGWQRTQYLPFFRIAGNRVVQGQMGRPGEVSITKRLTGGTQNLNDILDNMVLSTTKLITESIANQARRQVIDDSLRAGGAAAKVIRKVPKSYKAVTIDFTQIKKHFLDNLPRQDHAQASAMLDYVESNMGEESAQFWMHGQAPFGNNIVAIRRNGEMEYYEIADSLLLRSFAAMKRTQLDTGFQMISNFMTFQKRAIQKTITLGLDFMVLNPVRDAIHGAVFSDAGFIPVVDSIRGLSSRIKSDRHYRDFIANGGGMSSYYAEEGAIQKKLDKFLSKNGMNLDTIINTPGKMLAFLEAVGEGTEASTRVGEYRKAVARGETPRHAAYLGREVSTDFARRGDSATVAFFVDAAMFLNPGIQSLDRAYRGFTKDRNRVKIMALSAAIAAASAALAAANYDDEDYADQMDFVKDGYWHFYPVINSEKHHWTMPKIWEIGAMASVAERATIAIMDKMKKDHGDDGVKFGKHFFRIIFDQFSLNPTPAFYKPIHELDKNKVSYTGQQIVPDKFEKVPPWQQYDEKTPEFAKWLAELTREWPVDAQLSPAKVNHMVKSYLNFYGVFGMMLADRTFFEKNLPPLSTNDIPVVRKFTRDDSRTTKRQVGEFYDFYNEAITLDNGVKKLLREFEKPSQEEMESFDRNLAPVMSKVVSEIRKLNTTRALARNDPNITPEELEVVEKSVTNGINEITKGMMSKVDEEKRRINKGRNR